MTESVVLLALVVNEVRVPLVDRVVREVHAEIAHVLVVRLLVLASR